MSRNRKTIGTKTRFDVFKRDGFKCVYCGATPLAELLHVDHVVPVADGGANDMDNYCTSCAPCNMGKGARSLSDVPQSLADKAKNIAEQEAQIAGYQAILGSRRERIDRETWLVANIVTPDCKTFDRGDFQSIKKFIEKLGVDEVVDGMETTLARGFSYARTMKYFYGVCWAKVRELQNA